MMKSIYQAVFRNNDAVLPEAKKYSYSLPLAFCSRVVEAFLLVYAYFLVYPALQHLFSGTLTLEFILSTSLIMLVCFAARAVLFYYSAMHIYSGIYSINGAMSLKIAEHLKRLPLGHFQKRELNNVKSILTDDMNVISMYSGTLLGFFVTALCIPLFILIGLALIDWRFALALSVTTILALPVLKLTMAFIRHYGRKHLENMSATSARLVEYVLGIKVLKSYGMYGQRFDKLEQALTHQKNSSLTLELGAIGLLIIAFIAVELGLATALLYGSYSYLTAGQIDPAIFIFTLFLAARFYMPVQDALALSTEFNYLKQSFNRIMDIFKVPPQAVSNDETCSVKDHNIEFEAVSFSYSSNAEPALKDVSCVIPEKSVTALVGPSGSGKSTMTNLVARFWDVERGTVRIGGVDVKNMPAKDLMSMISIVFQDVMLFDDTVMENIRIARPEASDEDVYQASQLAYCHEFILRLPKGYDTMVGEAGSRLSGGEKQRISIARALLKNAPIVLLDEATASVDPSSERHIQKAFKVLSDNKTVIMIAHKLSTITHADQIIVLDNGRIIERGAHGELLDRDGLYAELWEKQRRASEWRGIAA